MNQINKKKKDMWFQKLIFNICNFSNLWIILIAEVVEKTKCDGTSYVPIIKQY